MNTFVTSFAQQRLWFLDQYDPGSCLYNIPAACRLLGTLDHDALKGSLDEIVQRHEAFRTTFAVEGGTPVQVIAAHAHAHLRFEDLCVRDDAETVAFDIAEREARQPFDLAQGPLMRVTVVKLADDEHLLVLVIHHIIADGWSIDVLLRELTSLYNARVEGSALPLNALDIQYADYSVWQHEWLQSGELETQLDYWKNRLEGAAPLLELPPGRHRPSVARHRGDTVDFSLDTALVTKLRQLSQRNQTSLYTTLASALNVLLSRYSCRGDICIGYPVANRGQPEIQGLVGFFVNTHVLRTNVNSADSFEALVQQVRTSLLESTEHHDLPFEKIVEALGPERSLSYSPLFQVMLAYYEGDPFENLRLSRLQVTGIPLRTPTAKFDLTVDLRSSSQGVTGVFEYDTDLFDREAVEQLARHYRVILEAVAAEPQRRIGDLPLMGGAEQRVVLMDWNDTHIEWPAPAPTLAEAFEAQVRLTPDAIAVSFDREPNHEPLTYGALNARANRLAHHLREHGVGPDRLVAVCMERSVDMIVALLGVLKAGGAYVPLDPAYPAERLAYLLGDTAAAVLITQSHLPCAPHLQHAQTVYLDGYETAFAYAPDHNPAGVCTSSHLAYCIYTSGSTGNPKGALNTHGAIVNRLLWMQHEYGLGPNDTVLQKTPFTFDVSVWEFFWPLLNGARLVIAKPEGHKDPAYLADAIQRHRVTTLHFVPSMLQAFLNAGMHLTQHALRQVFCSGEALPCALQQQFHRHFNPVKLHNLYGPTEAAVDVTFWHCEPGGDPTAASVPIGRPVANTRMYVLDGELRPVPPGVEGDLFIGGVQLARGYLKRPGLTAEKFIPNPYGVVGSRLYRTGDRARYRRDGVLEFLGRSDDQVKLRGLRIEPGEIENALQAHPDVLAAAVAVKGGTQGELYEAQLVGYVVMRAGRSLDNAALRAHLLQCLPDYMVPGIWMCLDALPLNVNGKLERKRLPEPDGASREASVNGTPYVAPRTPTETMLATLWAELLGVERIGIDDNFFELGGHSLLATQVIARVRQTLRIEAPIKWLFEAPTIRQFAAAQSDILNEAAPDTVAPPITASSEARTRRPASFAQERLYFLDRLKPDDRAYVVPVALELTGTLDVQALSRSVSRIVGRHEVLRTTFDEDDDGRTVAVVHAQPLDAMVYVDARGMDVQQRVAAEIEYVTLAPFDLRNGPLLRTHLVRTDESRYVFVTAMHHIVTDAWSVGVLMQELIACYTLFSGSGDATSTLAPLSIQYGDYAQWQRTRLTETRLAGQTDYWKSLLGGAPATVELPTDRPRPSMQTSAGDALRLAFSAGLSQRVDRLSLALGATPFMTLFAAFNVLLNRYANQDDLVIGTPIANRTHAETNPLIGFFANTLALRTRLSGEPTFREIVAQVKATTISAYTHQDIPFEKVVETLNVPRDTSRHPVFQVLFSLDNTPAQRLELPGLQARSLDIECQSAKFDISLEMSRTTTGDYTCRWEFNTDLYERTTIERMAGHFQTLVESACASPDLKAGMLPIMRDAERDYLTGTLNATARPIRQLPVHHLFEEVARRMPDSAAARFNGSEYSYAALNARANQFARHLQRVGVMPHSLVGICLERSLDVAIAILAVLKAGAACVPMDPSYPEERLRFMAKDAGAPVIVTQTHLLHCVDENDAQLVTIDDCAAAWTESATDPGIALDLRALCYVLYTSGSTGLPKGAALTHEMLTNLVQWQLTESTLPSGARTLQFSPLSFDVSFDEFFSTWAAGGTVVMVSDEVRKDPQQLLELVIQDDVARMFIPFVALQGIADAARALGTVGRLSEIVCGGEQLQVTGEVVDLFRKIPGGLLHNQYGPTESHFVTGFRLTGDPQTWPDLPPIGKPLANSQIYILDAYMQPVPPGVRGDLYIAGIHIAQSYWRRGGLTADRFVPNPFASAPGARMYRTGDVARYQPDGNIEYLGRSDHQVKIRGFRIELAEVEQALLTVEAVASAAAVAREDRPGLKQLVGYFVARPGMRLDRDSLRRELKQRVPEFMIPAAFVELEALPLTPSGKIDRRSLPMPGHESSGSEYVAPGTREEQELVRIWQDVLKVERVGIHDNFFDLGGHSLLAAQVLARIRQATGIAVPLRTLFEAPTIEKLASSMGGSATSASPDFATAPLGARAPLLPAQKRLWFVEELNPGSAAYHVPVLLELDGQLDTSALARALHTVVERHGALRTRIVTHEGQPFQQVLDAAAWTMTVEDLRGAREPDAALAHRVRESACHPFDFSSGEMFRATLFLLADARHALLLNVHHIAADGWSTGILLSETEALYRAFSAGQGNPLAPLIIQFADIAWSQMRRGRDEKVRIAGVNTADIAYWKKQLANAPAVHTLPLSHTRPAVLRMGGAVVNTTIDGPLTASLKAVASQHGATLFMALHSAFAALLGRYGNQDDVIIGTPALNRGQAELMPLIGMFVNTLVLRSDLSNRPNFSALVRQSKECILEAFTHEHVPFDQLVEALDVPRALSHAPLVQIMLVLENEQQTKFALPGIDARSTIVNTGTAKFDLTLYVRKREDTGLDITWEYNTSLFDKTYVEQLAGHFSRLVAHAVRNPDMPLAQIPLLDDTQRAELLRAGSGPSIAGSAPQTFDAFCLHELFEKHVSQRPDAIAVNCTSARLTYRELDERSNRLARYLIECGVRPDTLIGLCVERSTEMIVGMLAILKAGGAYVPLDPDYPAARLKYMVEDSAIRIVLTQHSLAHRLPPDVLEVGQIVHLDDAQLSEKLNRLPATRVPSRSFGLRPDHLAYVIYTSGSTGEPKGVLIEHRQVSRLLKSTERWFGFGQDDVWTIFHSYAFDFSVWEIWGALAYGGRAVIVPYLVTRSPREFLALLEKERVTVLNQTPTAFRALSFEAGSLDVDLALRYVIFGGEALDFSSLAPWFDRFGDRRPRLVNMYGITETTVHVTWHALTATDSQRTASVIGVPISDLSLYVLDEEGDLVPHQVVGELFVAGGGVARGYLNKPALTAERFVRNPFSDDGAKMYRTGDLVRYRADGTLEYVGRKDQQVKIRGFRIELGEVQATLSQAEGVAQALVIAQGIPGDQRLVAYIVPREGHAPDTATLRDELCAQLPDYMVPSAFGVLDAFPTTANGKVDIKALAQVRDRHLVNSTPFVGSRTPTEEVLCEIWKSTLGVARVGIHDDFFSLGGDSMLAVTIVHAARQQGLSLTVRDMYQHHTAAELSQIADANAIQRGPGVGERLAAQGETPTSSTLRLPNLVDFDPSLSAQYCDLIEDAYPLTAMQQRMVDAYDQSVQVGDGIYHVQMWSRIRQERPCAESMREAIQLVVDSQPVLRTRLLRAGGGAAWQGVARELEVELHVHDLRGQSEAQQALAFEQLLAQDRHLPLFSEHDSFAGLRFNWLSLDDDIFVLLISIHHAIDDGWGNQHFLRSIWSLYERIRTSRVSQSGRAVEPPPRAQNVFREYVALTRECEMDTSTASFWRGRTLACDGSAPLKRYRRLRADASGRGECSVAFHADTTACLYEVASSLHVSVKAIALAAYIALIENKVQAGKATIGVIANGRTDRLSEPLTALGLFWNLVPVSSPVLGTATAEEHIRMVHQALIETESHTLFPLNRICDLHGVDDLFFATFNFTNFHNAFSLAEARRISGMELLDAGWNDRFEYPLNCHVSLDRDQQKLQVHFTFDRAFLSQKEVSRWSTDYREILNRYLACLPS